MSNIRKFAGKKLLILGSNVGSSDIVKYAQKEGAYTIVADYLPPEKSAAKLIADEHWLISTTDIDTLYTKCIENKINGVFAGISELNLLNSMVLSEKLGLRFYCNREQWDLVENKACFRKLCQKYSVPCPKTYHIGGLLTQEQYSSIKYPVILKPIDRSSSIGVVICRSESDLKNSIYDSISKSSSGQIIIEEYIEGDEFAAHYTISEGRVCFSCIDNRYPVSVNEGIIIQELSFSSSFLSNLLLKRCHHSYLFLLRNNSYEKAFMLFPCVKPRTSLRKNHCPEHLDVLFTLILISEQLVAEEMPS